MGATCPLYNTTTGQIIEVDTVFNGSGAFMGLPLGPLGMQTMAHALGHALGLDHSCAARSIMCSDSGAVGFCNPNFDANCILPQTDDLNGVWNIYRDTDGDGCVVLEEDGSIMSLGGNRNKNNIQDFADFDASKKVDFGDFSIMLTWWNQFSPPAPSRVDIDGSGKVEFGDYTALLDQWNNSCRTGP